MLKNPFQNLQDRELEQSLLSLASGERESNADILLHLQLVKERKLYVPAGYANLFSYCTEHLGFSRSAAYRRKTVVDKISEFPSLVDRLRDGRLHLCAAAAVASHLRAETAELLLDEISGLSHREVEAFLVKKWKTSKTSKKSPEAAKSDDSSNVGTRVQTELLQIPDARVESGAKLGLNQSAPSTETTKAQDISSYPKSRTVVRAISENASRVSVSLNDKTLAKLKRAKELLTSKSDDEILAKALDRLLDQIAPERRHERREKRREKRRNSPKSRDAQPAAGELVRVLGDGPSQPQSVLIAKGTRRGRLADRDQVFAEAGGQCSFVAKDGRRCPERAFMELDHVRPFALGGRSTSDNLRLLCRAHNVFFAAKSFGMRSLEMRRADGPSVGTR